MSVDLNTISDTLGKNTSQATDNLKEAMTKASSGKPEDLVNMQMALQKWTMMNQLQSSMIQQLGECCKGIIQKMG
jgi:type III secretion apparatus needle protein